MTRWPVVSPCEKGNGWICQTFYWSGDEDSGKEEKREKDLEREREGRN